MGDHNVHNKEKTKKPKQGQGQNVPSFSSRPVFVPPTVIKKDRDNS